MKSLLTQYQNSPSICDCIIHILVLLSQIGSQSRLSIIRSNILENIDAVAFLHIDRKSLNSNIFTLFLELSDSTTGADMLVSVHCFDICVKMIQKLVRKERSEVENDIIVKAFQVIRSIVEKGTNVMASFLVTSGYSVIEEVWKMNPSQLDIQQALLVALMCLLQHEEGNEVLGNVDIPKLLLTEPPVNRILVAPLWSCIRFFVQRHSKLINTTNLQQILQGASRYGREYPQEEVFVFHLSWTLFTISSLRRYSIAALSLAIFVVYEPLRSDLESVVCDLKQRYRKNIDLSFQFGYVESLLAKPLVMDEIILISGTDKDISLVAEVQSVLQEEKLAQAEFSRLLDTLISSCELSEMTHLVVTSKLPSTLLQMIPRYLLIDGIMTKIISVFVTVAEHDISDADVFKRLCLFIEKRLSQPRSVSVEYLLGVASLLELISDDRIE